MDIDKGSSVGTEVTGLGRDAAMLLSLGQALLCCSCNVVVAVFGLAR
jgi:hypothetical protein